MISLGYQWPHKKDSFPPKIKKKKKFVYMSHFSYSCKMWYPLNLVLENWEYLWFY